MARSIKKGPFVDGYLVKKIEGMITTNKKSVVKTWSRRSTILPEFVGHTFAVHNGRKFIPVFVTENGIATTNDAVRADFLREHVLVMRHARSAGLDLRGYFHWSLLDNFEWLEGFAPRFGLFEVDYGTLARRRRPSADLFAELGKGFLRESFTRT